MKLSRSAIVPAISLTASSVVVVSCVLLVLQNRDQGTPTPEFVMQQNGAGNSAVSSPSASVTTKHAVAPAKPAVAVPRTSPASRYVAPVQPQQAAAPTDSSTPAADPSVDQTLPVSQGTVDQGGVTRPPSAAPPVPVTTAPRG